MIDDEAADIFEADGYYCQAGSPREPQVKEPLTPNTALLADYHVAEILGIGVRTVWSLASSREIPQPTHLGRLAKWKRKDIEAWLAMKK